MSHPRLGPGRTAFLDRDGTINVSPPEGEFLTSPADLRLLPGAGEAVRLLNEAGALVILATNQRGISLGLMSEDDLAAIHERLTDELAEHGAHLDAIYFCPHAKGACGCRKPAPGMLERAAREVEGVELEGAAMVGDSARDVEAGNRVGLTTVRLGETDVGDPNPDHDAPDLLSAVRWLCGEA